MVTHSRFCRLGIVRIVPLVLLYRRQIPRLGSPEFRRQNIPESECCLNLNIQHKEDIGYCRAFFSGFGNEGTNRRRTFLRRFGSDIG